MNISICKSVLICLFAVTAFYVLLFVSALYKSLGNPLFPYGDDVLSMLVLESQFSKNEYFEVEEIYSSHSSHIRNLVSFIENEIIVDVFKKNDERDLTLLDIGPGPAIITKELSKFFKSTTVVEPNEQYVDLYEDLGYDAHFVNFQYVYLDDKFDLVLCSHVMYHIQRSMWWSFLQKMKNQASERGRVLVAITSPRGNFFEFQLSLSKRAREADSSAVIEELDRIGIPYSIFPQRTVFKTKDFEDFHKVVRLFVIDDSYEIGEFSGLSEEDQNKTLMRIWEFSKGCENDDGWFELQIEEDYFIF